MKIEYSKKSIKFLAKQDKTTVKRIRIGIEKLTLTPPEGDIKPMQGDNKGRMRLRIGSYRIIFRYSELDNSIIDVLFIEDIGNRGNIYK